MRPKLRKTHVKRRAPVENDYVQALRSLTPLPPSYMRMLEFHYQQPAKTATAEEMARAAGFKNFRAASLHYGRLAGLVGERIGWRRKTGEIKLYVLSKFRFARGRWHWIMRKELAGALEKLGWVGHGFELMPGEMPEKSELREGATYRVAVTAYERNGEARAICLEHYGTCCFVCGIDLKAVYGPVAEGFIHVHHLRMLSEVGEEYTIDPVKDLRPVCPNCHSVIHLKAPPYGIDELKAIVAARRQSK